MWSPPPGPPLLGTPPGLLLSGRAGPHFCVGSLRPSPSVFSLGTLGCLAWLFCDQALWGCHVAGPLSTPARCLLALSAPASLPSVTVAHSKSPSEPRHPCPLLPVCPPLYSAVPECLCVPSVVALSTEQAGLGTSRQHREKKRHVLLFLIKLFTLEEAKVTFL